MLSNFLFDINQLMYLQIAAQPCTPHPYGVYVYKCCVLRFHEIRGGGGGTSM